MGHKKDMKKKFQKSGVLREKLIFDTTTFCKQVLAPRLEELKKQAVPLFLKEAIELKEEDKYLFKAMPTLIPFDHFSVFNGALCYNDGGFRFRDGQVEMFIRIVLSRGEKQKRQSDGQEWFRPLQNIVFDEIKICPIPELVVKTIEEIRALDEDPASVEGYFHL